MGKESDYRELAPEREKAGGNADSREQFLAELGSQTRPGTNSSQKTIDIADADKTFGWWQKKQYQELGVERIHLGTNSVSLELKAPKEKYNTLQIDRQFSFKFNQENSGAWTLSDIKGLKLKGADVTRVESNSNNIRFQTADKKEKEYGNSVNKFMKALLDPLMRKDLRN